MKNARLLAVAFIVLLPPAAAAPSEALARSVHVTILSTMLATRGIGEWGFAALVEADGHRILFDTGARPRTVLDNAKELGIDLSSVEEVVLSHNHADHLLGATDEQLAWTGERLRAMGVANLVGAHCTGIEAVFRLREATGLDRGHAVVGAVGASFDLEKGIDPLLLAR